MCPLIVNIWITWSVKAINFSAMSLSENYLKNHAKNETSQMALRIYVQFSGAFKTLGQFNAILPSLCTFSPF